MLHPPLTDLEYLQSQLASAGVRPARSAGQNFLISPEVVEATLMVTAEGPEAVTELGAGTGVLTCGLLAQSKKVRAIEQDAGLLTILKKHAKPKTPDQLMIVPTDLRETEWAWTTPYQVVGNIPYNLSGLIIRRLTELDPAPRQVVLLVQKEVGERLYATPPDMHLSSVAVQLWGEATPILTAPAACFWPAPQVDSQLILLTPHQPPLASWPEREAAIGLAKRAFQQRRKQLGSSLNGVGNLSKEAVVALLNTQQIQPTQRPQELTPQQWLKLAAEVA